MRVTPRFRAVTPRLGAHEVNGVLRSPATSEAAQAPELAHHVVIIGIFEIAGWLEARESTMREFELLELAHVRVRLTGYGFMEQAKDKKGVNNETVS